MVDGDGASGKTGPDPALIGALRQAVANAGAGPLNAIVDPVLEENKARVRHRALLLLDQRSRSRDELKTRLERLEFDPELIEMVLDDLQRANLVDDLAFARQWVRQRHERRGKSKQMLDKELRDKGVDADCRAQALDEIDDADERDKARGLAGKKAATVTVVPGDRAEYDKHLRRILGMLARRGFPQSMSMALAKQALDNRLDELRAQQ